MINGFLWYQYYINRAANHYWISIVITEIGLSLWNYWNASIITEIQDFVLKDEKLGVGVEFKIDLFKLLLYHIHMR